MPTLDRPRPLQEAARVWGLIVGGIGAVVAFAVTSQVLNVGQANSLNAAFTAADVLISAAVALITAGASVLSAFRTATVSEPKVTPIEDPRLIVDRHLVKLVPETVTH